MNPKDKIVKASMNLLAGAKDLVKANLVQSVRSQKILVDNATLQLIFTVVDASIDEGFHKGNLSFEKEIDSALVTHLSVNNVVATDKKKIKGS